MGMSALHLLAAMRLQRATFPHLCPADWVHTEKTDLILPFFPFLSFRNYPELVNCFTTVLEGSG